jgi:hypothetical protein
MASSLHGLRAEAAACPRLSAFPASATHNDNALLTGSHPTLFPCR